MFMKKKKNKRSVPNDIPIIWVNIIDADLGHIPVLL